MKHRQKGLRNDSRESIGGKIPLGFHHSRRDFMEAVAFFRFCCLLARPIGLANENTGTRTAHCLCQLPPGCAALHNPHRFWTGPLHPAPSHSVRSRRTSHGPHADCSFRLAIFELTRSTAFQPQEERRTASVSPFSHLEAKELTFSCPE